MNAPHSYRNSIIFLLIITLTFASPAYAARNLRNAVLSENWAEANSLFWTSGDAKQSGSLNVTLTRYVPAPVQPGQEMDLFLQVVNRRGLPSGAWLEVINEYPFTVLPTSDVERAKNLKVLVGNTLQFRVKVADDAKDGIAKLQVRYGVSNDFNDYRKTYFDIQIRTFDPVLNIEEIRQEPAEIAPGDYGKVSIMLKNHGHLTLQNIALVLDLTGKFDPTTNLNNNIAMQAMMNARLQEVDVRIASGQSPLMGFSPVVREEKKTEMRENPDFAAFTPIGSSTQKVVTELKPGEAKIVTFDIQALPDAKSRVYTTPVYVNYNDKYNSPFMIQSDIGLKVNMKPDLYIALESSTLRSSFFMGEITVKVANRGQTELRYAAIKLEDNEKYQILTAPQSIYLGTLNPGEDKTGTFKLVPKEKGPVIFPFTVTFRDAYNQEHSQKIELPLNIINQEYYRDVPLEFMAVWLVLGIVVLILVVWYVRSPRKTTLAASTPPPTSPSFPKA